MKNTRGGFSVVVAILVMVLISSILVLSLSLSSKSIKQTTDIYLKAQAEILARSATEYAVLAISGHDRSSGNCLENINLSYNNMFDANMTIMYIGDNLQCNMMLANDIKTSESNVTVVIDTIVSVKNGIADEPIRIHRRTIQKP